MDRVAIFVDAGYLFAQGSVAIAGEKQPRSLVTLDENAAITELAKVAKSQTGSVPLLRIYWYDGIIPTKGLTAEHALVADLENVKFRFGFINRAGQQKGVDSLIVTDLIDLARNGAISDAVLLSGDEDIRVGVQVAQNFGVRVHLLGIVPSRGSQSLQLLQEADTTTEFDAKTVSKFLKVRTQPKAKAKKPADKITKPDSQAITPSSTKSDKIFAELDRVSDEMMEGLGASDIKAIKAYFDSDGGVPPEYDGRLLAQSRERLGRDLGPPEKTYIRKKFKTSVRDKS